MTSFIPATGQDFRDCLTHPSQVVETAAGPVEYAVRGEGPVLLSVHGGPGGYDQGLAIGECFRQNGFKILAPSRPGYLQTPLGAGTTPEGQADVLAALIDALNLGQVLVAGASAGGPPSYTLAQRHPDKVAALVEIDSVSIHYTKGQELSKTQEAIFLSKAGLWVMDWFMRHFPEPMVKSFMTSESTLEGHELDDHVKRLVKDQDKLEFVRVMTKTMSERFAERKTGVFNDLSLLESIDKLPLNNISCPTLILHGDADGDVPPSHAEYAHQAIKGSDMYWIKNGSHIAFWAADQAREAQKYAVDWLKKLV